MAELAKDAVRRLVLDGRRPTCRTHLDPIDGNLAVGSVDDDGVGGGGRLGRRDRGLLDVPLRFPLTHSSCRLSLSRFGGPAGGVSIGDPVGGRTPSGSSAFATRDVNKHLGFLRIC